MVWIHHIQVSKPIGKKYSAISSFLAFIYDRHCREIKVGLPLDIVTKIFITAVITQYLVQKYFQPFILGNRKMIK